VTLGDNLAINSLASGSRAARITFVTDGFKPDGLDPISLQNFGNLISENHVAQAALNQVQKIQTITGGKVTLYFKDGPRNLAGSVNKTIDGGMNMDMYMLHNANVRPQGAVSTFVHESSHYMRGSRGFEIGTQVDEYMAFRRELLFELGRKPTIAERQAMWLEKIVESEYYSSLPVGGELPRILQGLGG